MVVNPYLMPEKFIAHYIGITFMQQAHNIAITHTELTTCYSQSSLSSDMSSFLTSLSLKGRRPGTIRTYSEALKSVFRTLEQDYGTLPDPRMLSAQDFGYLRGAMTVCDSSKKLYLVVLGRFVEFLTGHNPRMEADLLWNDDDKRRLFISPDQFKVLMYRGDPLERLVLSLGAYMGLRRSEMAGIRLGDMEDGHLRVRGKGHGPDGKVMNLFIPLQVQKCIDAYLLERSRIVMATGTMDDHLILSQGRNPGRGVSGNRIGDIVKKLGRRCGVRLTAHSLRRLHATALYSQGVDLNTIRLMMRHASLNTTLSCYIQADPENMTGARKALEGVLG